MAYIVELRGSFTGTQGLRSPVRARTGLPSLANGEGFSVLLRAGLQFTDDQLTARGWFVDTDAAQQAVDECCTYLASDVLTNLFDFRPTFELVASNAFHRLASRIRQLGYVTLDNETLGVTTRYEPSQESSRPPGGTHQS